MNVHIHNSVTAILKKIHQIWLALTNFNITAPVQTIMISCLEPINNLLAGLQSILYPRSSGLFKCSSHHVTPLLKSVQWLSITLWINLPSFTWTVRPSWLLLPSVVPSVITLVLFLLHSSHNGLFAVLQTSEAWFCLRDFCLLFPPLGMFYT